MSVVYKIFPAISKAVDKEAGIYEVMISTEAIDRDGDIVRAAGGIFENYLRNAVVLFGHDYRDLPIGKTLEINVLPGSGVRVKFQFPAWGLSDKADAIRKLWDAGFLNAASIGFTPIKSINLDPQKPWGPQDYIEWELLEWSIVTVPANQDALRLTIGNLSTMDRRALHEAADEINKALSRLEPDKQERDEETNTDLTLNNGISREALEQIFTLLDNLFEVK